MLKTGDKYLTSYRAGFIIFLIEPFKNGCHNRCFPCSRRPLNKRNIRGVQCDIDGLCLFRRWFMPENFLFHKRRQRFQFGDTLYVREYTAFFNKQAEKRICAASFQNG
ncbi:Uncharacterised protein [Klebsiella pneumoniae]|nr:Uncharacterised protein [Klebsiella pneumoniae]